MNIQTGFAAHLSLDASTGKWKATYQGKILALSQDRKYIIDTITRGLNKTANACGVTHVTELNSGTIGELLQSNGFEIPIKPEFTITERFEFLTNLAQMSIEGTAVAVLVTGEGGLGKSHTIMEEIKAAGLTLTSDFSPPPPKEKLKGKDAKTKDTDEDEDEDDEDEIAWINPGQVHLIKGFSSPKGLYRALFENNGKLVIFDDCDSIQKNADAVNILKGALDSSDERWISWNAEEGRGNSLLPKAFKFTGRVIFISNFSQHRIDPNLKTRCMRVDLTMTSAEKIERMRYIIGRPSFQPTVSTDIKEEAVMFLEDNMEVATSLSLRSLLETIKYRVRNASNWERQALYSLTA